MTKYTDLTRKERNRIRYGNRMVRVANEREAATRTKSSDIAVPRLTDGMSMKPVPQSAYTNLTPIKRRALPMHMLGALIEALDPKNRTKKTEEEE